MSFSDKTMKAVTFTGPYAVSVTTKPIPIANPGEVIVKVLVSGLCGSDLHQYRGHDPSDAYGFTCGHEFVGHVSEVGEGLEGKFEVGQRVVAPFTISCGECFFCVRGFTGRCEKSRLFGCERLEGAQAEYVRVPMAASSLVIAPPQLPSSTLLLMADIFPTGCIVVKNAWNLLTPIEKAPPASLSSNSTSGPEASAVDEAGQGVEGEQAGHLSACVIGCGPVGLCAIMAAKEKFGVVFAIDPVQERLDMARKYGANPIPLNTDPSAYMSTHLSTLSTSSTPLPTAPDVLLEVVGSPSALNLAISLVRHCGVVSSCGVHTANLDIPGPAAYGKGVRMQFGRCHARAMFDESLVLLEKIGRVQPELLDEFVQKRIKLDEAPEYYKLFDQRKIGKVIFDLELQ